MKQIVTIHFDTDTLTEIIEAKKPIDHYVKHYPRAGGLHHLHRNQAHAQDKLAILRRAVRFMDRYDLISCPTRQRSLQALSLGGVLPKCEQMQHDPVRYRDVGLDHVTFWRRAGDKAPRAIHTEPYRIDARTKQSYDELADRFVLEYHINNDNALWHPLLATAVLWHRAGESLIVPQYAAKAA